MRFFTKAVQGVDLDKWCHEHDVEPFSAPCQECKAERTCTIPFAYKHMRGLCAPPCAACGDKSGVPFVIGPRVWEQPKAPKKKRGRAKANVIPLRRSP